MPFRGSLQDIRLFVAAYEERSFTAAAAREFSTQSGVSHHIRQLEDLLGVKLFVRDKAGVVSTPVGDLYYRHCVELLRSLDDATHQVTRFAGGFAGSIVVGLIPALTHRVAAPALLRFTGLHPNVKVRIVESYSSSTSELVASGAVDFAISTLHGGASPRTTPRGGSVADARDASRARCSPRALAKGLRAYGAAGPRSAAQPCSRRTSIAA